MPRPTKCISVAEAKALQQEWWDTRLEVTTNGHKHQDTCEFHFSLEELQEFLDYVKEESDAAGIKSPGINIWFGAYQAKESRPNLSTIFLSATKKKNGEEVDEYGRDYDENPEIDPMNDNSGPWPPLQYNP
ncbi:MAG: hypothetical protein VX712_00705 [Bacteroidota bacterium]|uniref:Uncharacterized protein n=1 Tax=Christiangramia flava JLT2011 TaxID=1229726 RepID=A0A1L7I182_9FLAO|nr:hypothetical protein [Christiangramia flava]MAM17961.1 hypothetical protein [Christiangramia sp.]MEE2770704.1 hypothetical protein [Bacteroidota bacterium]APU66905.1 hypothetical protein GRFL_0181 [Christiangramia flava JLT2011]MAM19226.1 hypothetical protein [Christiangramia sp.]OSS38004.1 hypothetical protein C723_3093 [Christiangramia flava JLT2011]|tara:strand:+ start:228 stop:620 length:393 start_codon:yes stop_codon:yes gene_type:complete